MAGNSVSTDTKVRATGTRSDVWGAQTSISTGEIVGEDMSLRGIHRSSSEAGKGSIAA